MLRRDDVTSTGMCAGVVSALELNDVLVELRVGRRQQRGGACAGQQPGDQHGAVCG